MQKYLVIIEKAPNNYSAFSPDVPGCVATGVTVEETISEMKSALEFHLESLDEIPEAKGLRYHLDSGDLVYEEGSFFTELEIQTPVIA